MNNSLVAQLSTVIDNISKHFQPASKQLPETSVDTSPKLVRNSSETYETPTKPSSRDGRSKPRTQRQIESYKKNFSHRHKSRESIPQLLGSVAHIGVAMVDAQILAILEPITRVACEAAHKERLVPRRLLLFELLLSWLYRVTLSVKEERRCVSANHFLPHSCHIFATSKPHSFTRPTQRRDECAR